MIYSLFSVGVAMLGLSAMLSRKTLMGWMIGMQLVVQSMVLFGVFVGNSHGREIHGQTLSFFLLFLGLTSVVAGLSLAMRLFYLRKSILLSNLKRMRH